MGHSDRLKILRQHMTHDNCGVCCHQNCLSDYLTTFCKHVPTQNQPNGNNLSTVFLHSYTPKIIFNVEMKGLKHFFFPVLVMGKLPAFL